MKYLDSYLTNLWLSLNISMPQEEEVFLNRLSCAINLSPNTPTISGQIATYQLIHAWLKSDYVLAYNIVKEHRVFCDLEDIAINKALKVFFGFILNLCITWQFNRNLYQNLLHDYKELYVFGESHSLSLSNVNFSMNSVNFHANSNFIMGIKMHHLANPTLSHHSFCLVEYFKLIKPNTDIFLAIGEIDTRPDEGIWQVHLKNEKDLVEIIKKTAIGYIEFIATNLKDKIPNSITIQGIPAPGYPLEGNKDPGNKEVFLGMVKQVNEILKEVTLSKGWFFLDVYTATVGEDGTSNKLWHLDGYHLQPLFYSYADKWLVK